MPGYGFRSVDPRSLVQETSNPDVPVPTEAGAKSKEAP